MVCSPDRHFWTFAGSSPAPVLPPLPESAVGHTTGGRLLLSHCALARVPRGSGFSQHDGQAVSGRQGERPVLVVGPGRRRGAQSQPSHVRRCPTTATRFSIGPRPASAGRGRSPGNAPYPHRGDGRRRRSLMGPSCNFPGSQGADGSPCFQTHTARWGRGFSTEP